MSMLFAATYPDRTRALALYGTYAHYPTWVLSAEKLEAFIEADRARLGHRRQHPAFSCLARHRTKRLRRGWARWERQGGSPSTVVALTRMNARDRRAPHPARDTRADPGSSSHRRHPSGCGGRAVSRRSHYRRAVCRAAGKEITYPLTITDRLADEIEEFLTGSRAEAEPDRVLSTVHVHRHGQLNETRSRARRPRLASSSRSARRRCPRGARSFSRPRGEDLGRRLSCDLRWARRAVCCASAIIDRVRPLGMDVRSGLHTGEIEIQRDDVGGIAVHIAARVVGLAGTGEVLVSSTVRDLVAGSGLRFHDRGSHPEKDFQNRCGCLRPRHRGLIRGYCRREGRTCPPSTDSALSPI